MYQERMLGYYPPVIQSILEFQAIIDSEYPEIEGIVEGVSRVTTDAYLTTMSEERVKQWESLLGIQPLENAALSDRRNAIIARIRGQGKLNTEAINRIVSAFTGGTAVSWIENNTLNVRVGFPDGRRDYSFTALEQELTNKVPAHLGVAILRDFMKWLNVNETFSNWGEVYTSHRNWEDVMNGLQQKAGRLDYSALDSFMLA